MLRNTAVLNGISQERSYLKIISTKNSFKFAEGQKVETVVKGFFLIYLLLAR